MKNLCNQSGVSINELTMNSPIKTLEILKYCFDVNLFMFKYYKRQD
jgi:hypothetical protein